MLELKDICKEYKTGGHVQKALDHVSLNFRSNEFVAILGPSGSGKTTLLNIVGGLDRYDSGDLVIGDVSTKKYSDRDWDAYRNHTIGFIFQSYNLIPHQTILANVELALTIAGVSKSERKRRASEALQKVGLGDQLHKKPAQLSGGQMQRVAIARALVNDPDILLADEPTGALDSETSVQVMELLKEVASDRLVIMVTHNPELADLYATRIVNLKDGVIRSDTDPYEPENAAEPPEKKTRMGRASMSWGTALMLSLNNLWTKKTRTILVSFAGSIGIIGIALILSLSNGADNYIQSVEEDTLQEYPVQLKSTSFDSSSFYAAAEDGSEEDEALPVTERKTVTNMFTTLNANDLGAFKEYIETEAAETIAGSARAVEYDYGISPMIYSLRDGKLRQVNPNQTFAAMGFSSGSGLFSSMIDTDIFHALPETPSLYEEQYDIMAGRWPESYNELVLVLSGQNSVSDLSLYAMGLKDSDRLDELISAFSEGETIVADEEAEGRYAYDDFLGITFRLVNITDTYAYDEEYGVWTDKSGDDEYMLALAESAETLTVVGVARPAEDASSTLLDTGLDYPASLIAHISAAAAQSDIIRAQLDDPDTDVFTGRVFGDDERGGLALDSLFSVDGEALQDAFQFDTDGLSVDLSGMDMSGLDFSDLVDASAMSAAFPDAGGMDLSDLLSGIRIQLSMESVEALFGELVGGYLTYSESDAATDYAKLPEAVRDYSQTDEARERILAGIRGLLRDSGAEIVSAERLQGIIAAVMEGFPDYVLSVGLPDAQELVTGYLTGTLDEEGLRQLYSGYLTGYLQTPAVRQVLEAEVAALANSLSGITFTEEQMRGVTSDILAGYEEYAAENALPDPARLRDSFTEYMDTDEARQIIADTLAEAIDTDELAAQAASSMRELSSGIGTQLASVMGQIMSRLTAAITEGMTEAMGSLGDNLGDAFRFDTDMFAEAISMDMSETDLQELLATLLSTDSGTYAGNLKKLGYADRAKPSSITLYPTDFAGKTSILQVLSDYNDKMMSEDMEEKTIRYNDVVGTMMNSVTNIVDTISYVLVAFVAISLVVSSIMIGVITYISVLERKKEIGILRSVGASKRNISEVFNAETFIIGALAGLMGVGLTALMLHPINYIIQNLAGRSGIHAALPGSAAVVLVLLSIVLTLIGGLIPAKKAAKSDPVIALRTD